jgi:hypothetical protein
MIIREGNNRQREMNNKIINERDKKVRMAEEIR